MAALRIASQGLLPASPLALSTQGLLGLAIIPPTPPAAGGGSKRRRQASQAPSTLDLVILAYGSGLLR